jgi:uncharacterized protein
MKVLIYGPTGNIGGRITGEALRRDHEVTVAVREASAPRFDGQPLHVVVGDVLDSRSVAAHARGYDAVVSAVGAGIRGPHPAYEVYRKAAVSLIGALRGVGDDAPRLVVVGGAGSLYVAPGVRLVDTPQFPAIYKTEALAQAEALDFYLLVSDVAWTYVSPAAIIEPGERTGRYRTGHDQLLADDAGNSTISMEDFAVAVIDELETPRAIGRRLSVAY